MFTFSLPYYGDDYRIAYRRANKSYTYFVYDEWDGPETESRPCEWSEYRSALRSLFHNRAGYLLAVLREAAEEAEFYPAADLARRFPTYAHIMDADC